MLQEMASVEREHANRLFYLALPPSVFKPVTSMLKVSRECIAPVEGFVSFGRVTPGPADIRARS